MFPVVLNPTRSLSLSLKMGYSTESAEWPDIAVPEKVKQLIDAFFATLDSTEVSAGDILADEIFATDGIAYFSSKPFCGTDGKALPCARRVHQTLRYYLSTKRSDDHAIMWERLPPVGTMLSIKCMSAKLMRVI